MRGAVTGESKDRSESAGSQPSVRLPAGQRTPTPRAATSPQNSCPITKRRGMITGGGAPGRRKVFASAELRLRAAEGVLVDDLWVGDGDPLVLGGPPAAEAVALPLSERLGLNSCFGPAASLFPGPYEPAADVMA